MTTILKLRRIDGTEVELGVDDGRFIAPAGDPSEVLDLRDLVTLPGLADCHAHLAASSIDSMVAGSDVADLELMRHNARLDLDAGVLLALDKGFRSDDGLRFLAEPPESRPHLEMAGEIVSEPGGYYVGFGLEVDPTQLTEAVAAKAATPAQWVKLIGDWPRPGRGAVPSFSEESLAGAVRAAHALGKRLAVHTMAPDAPGMAVRAGVDSIEHGLFLTDSDLRELGARGGAWVPTIAAVERLIDSLGADSSGGKLLRRGLDRVRQLLSAAPRLGVVVLAGTDLSVPHGELATEAAALVRYGMSAEDAVHSVSLAAYDYVGLPDPLGEGADADLVALDGDPRDDITILQRPRLVMRRGRVVRREGI